jgi:3-oxoacyl-[acyl-carrier-protein] synthase II
VRRKSRRLSSYSVSNMNANKRVVITGLGAVTSIGIGKEAFWKSLLQGKSGISPVTAFDTTAYFTHNGGEVKAFEPSRYIPAEQASSLSRACQMALVSGNLAVADAGLDMQQLVAVQSGACLGITSGPVQVIEHINDVVMANKELKNELLRQLPVNTASAILSRQFQMTGPNLLFSTACAAGNYSIGYGYDLIRFGRAEVMLAGASDPFSRISFTGFNQFSAVAPEKCQPFDKNRKGMMVAEGAGVLILESLEHAKSRNAVIYAEILGYGLSCDAHHMTTSSVEGIAACMRNALRAAGIASEDVDYISAHGTGTPTNDRNECAAIKTIFGHRSGHVPVSSIKSMLGHTMGAASTLEAIACALAIRDSMIPPTINYETPDPDCDIDCVPNVSRKHPVGVALNNSYAFGGNNACLVLKKFLS